MHRLAVRFPADVDFLNRETSTFLDGVTDSGRKLK